MSNDVGGNFVWYELLSSDPEGAIRFYTAITGWQTQDWQGEGDVAYTMFTRGDVPVAGVMQLPEEAREQGVPPHWLGYVTTPDVDASAARAAELGGAVLVEPQDIPEVGRFSVLADPQGAVFAAYTPAGQPPGAGSEPEVGDVSWHELAARDHEEAFAFYAELFGWDATDAMELGEMGTYQMFGPGRTVGGMFDRPAEMPGPPAWLYYIRVEDVDPAAETVRAEGGQVLHGPVEVPGGDRIVQCLDPQDGAFALHAMGGEPE